MFDFRNFAEFPDVPDLADASRCEVSREPEFATDIMVGL